MGEQKVTETEKKCFRQAMAPQPCVFYDGVTGRGQIKVGLAMINMT